MNPSFPDRRFLAVIAALLPLFAALVYLLLREGPLAPVAVTVTTVKERALQPAVAGIGTVEARRRFQLGPTRSGRLLTVAVDVGDRVGAGEVVAELAPVDIPERLLALQAAQRGAAAQLREAQAHADHARAQHQRYQRLLAARTVSEEFAAARARDLAVAEAAVRGAGEELSRLAAEYEALEAQRDELLLRSPVAGLVVNRSAEPGSALQPGETVIEVIELDTVWVDARFDQYSAQGLAAGLPASVSLRSRPGESFAGRIARLEPLADAVTEELRAKVAFTTLPGPLPPLGELAEVTVTLPALPAAPTVEGAALRRVDGALGVWQMEDGQPAFRPVATGQRDLSGHVQLVTGPPPGTAVVLHSDRALGAASRLVVREQLSAVGP
jgi:HlyD family secretion protein